MHLKISQDIVQTKLPQIVWFLAAARNRLVLTKVAFFLSLFFLTKYKKNVRLNMNLCNAQINYV
jgi:hypothetical protein